MPLRFLSEVEPWVDQTVELLQQSAALPGLRKIDARALVDYMRPCRYDDGDVLLREGERPEDAAMLLVLHGEVSIEVEIPRFDSPVVISVVGEGAVLGELALMDGETRNASCVAQSTVVCASLFRTELNRLMVENPPVAVRLLAGIGQHLAARVREADRQHRLYHQLVRALQDELDEANRVLQETAAMLAEPADGQTSEEGADGRVLHPGRTLLSNPDTDPEAETVGVPLTLPALRDVLSSDRAAANEAVGGRPRGSTHDGDTHLLPRRPENRGS